MREAREGQVLNASAQIHRDESGKYSNGTRPPQRCPFAIRGLSKHMSIRTGGRLTTNSRRPFSFILCGLERRMRPRIESRKAAGRESTRSVLHPPPPWPFFLRKREQIESHVQTSSVASVLPSGSSAVDSSVRAGRHLAGPFSSSSTATMYGMLLESVQHFIQVGQTTDFVLKK